MIREANENKRKQLKLPVYFSKVDLNCPIPRNHPMVVFAFDGEPKINKSNEK